MHLTNNSEKFGILTKYLHWIIFALFMVQYFLVYRREYFPKESPEKALYMMLHKSFGVCLLFLALLMLTSRYLGKRPAMPMSMSTFEIIAAKLTHFALYVVMLFMPISGIAMSLLGGYKISFFGWYDLPNFFSKNEELAEFFYHAHVWCSYVVIAFVSIHIFAALYHHYIKKDVVLRRMLPFR